ncbi:transcriptional regulator [Cupriavidus basilensis]|uniref:transcriptional regulator n=1 Tax=Cupriavidus basilensis TaxID=68895 RepID=UPI0028431FFD|nr:helix-turn-helix domain-containing protein [Cupriavidus basilensis]MDR3382290.1 helix-turn-helix domain-containing protein [Cupriavidus basilensis]
MTNPCPENDTLLSAIEAAGGITKLARAIGVSTQRVSNWRDRRVPAEHCPDIEATTGVRCEHLRPDVNWAVLRGSALAASTPVNACPLETED